MSSNEAKAMAGVMLAAVGGYLIWRQSQGQGAVIDLPGALAEFENQFKGEWFADLTGGGLKLSAWQTPPAGIAFENLFVSASKQYGIPAGLLSRQAYQESRYNPRAHNLATDARGIMQIVPKWHPEIADPFNAAQAIPYAAKYLAAQYRRFGSWDKALAAYNWGPNAFGNWLAGKGDNWLAAPGLPAETRNYVAQIGKDAGILYYGTTAQGVA